MQKQEQPQVLRLRLRMKPRKHRSQDDKLVGGGEKAHPEGYLPTFSRLSSQRGESFGSPEKQS
jgi:hypothetical protein